MGSKVTNGFAAKREVISSIIPASAVLRRDAIDRRDADKACVEFLRRAPPDRFDVLGFPLGGHDRAELAAINPELVRRIILTGREPARGDGLRELSADELDDEVG